MARGPLSARARARLAWCAPALFLGAVLVALWIVLARPPLFGVVLALLVVVPAGYALVSALWPARAERRCPGCGADALARSDPRSTVGLRCTACSWSDDSASAWLLAEEEGPLEELVLAARGRRVRMDSPRRPD